MVILKTPSLGFRYFSVTSSNAPTLGFIGLGQMGSHMARNLLTKHSAISKFVVYDTHQPAIDKFLQSIGKDLTNKVHICKSPREVSQLSPIIVTMLPSSPHVKYVYLEGKDCLIKGLDGQRKSILIDSSTIDPGTSKLVAEKLKSAGHLAVDAPVSGGVGGAQAGTLTFMVGSDTKGDFDIIKPYLSLMGKNIVYCGSNGSGQVAKICNNMLLGISMIASAETMNLGIRLGMDPKVLQSIIASSSGRCWSIDTYNTVPGVLENVPSSRQYQGGFAVELMTKDLQLACQAASDSKSFNILGNITKGLYETICNSSVESADGKLERLAGKDFSVAFKWMNDNGKKF